MDDVLSLMPTPQTEAEYQAAIEHLLTEMQQLNQQMRDDQDEIERLQAESRRIKVQTDAIKARVLRRLESLEAMVCA